jgi:stage II sporulation protein AA (anti-sigma F factor antagonist)
MWMSRTRGAGTGAPGAEAHGRLRCQGCAASCSFAPDEADCPLGLPPAADPPPRPPAAGGAEAQLAISVLRREDHVLVRLKGELDLATICRLRFMLRAVLAEASRLAVDVTGLGFTDVLGIRTLREAGEQAARAGGWVRIIGAGPQFRRLLDLLGAARVLPVYPGEQDAVRPGSPQPEQPEQPRLPGTARPAQAAGPAPPRSGGPRA